MSSPAATVAAPHPGSPNSASFPPSSTSNGSSLEFADGLVELLAGGDALGSLVSAIPCAELWLGLICFFIGLPFHIVLNSGHNSRS